ncbi:MAG: T9SS type A sorting domain-containing protein [Saprospiraceae bacterium]|nr:T9SS type A sorting domain-containing protein [Saprospiraceae bacterium]
MNRFYTIIFILFSGLSWAAYSYLPFITGTKNSIQNKTIPQLPKLNNTGISLCEMADVCSDISSAQTLQTAPTDVNCGDFNLTSIEGCLENALPEDSLSHCAFNNNPTVWFKIETDSLAKQLFTFVSTPEEWQPVWAVYYGDCDNLIPVYTSSLGIPVACSNEGNNPAVHNITVPTGINGNPVTTFYIAVSAAGIQAPGNFTLSAFTQADCDMCSGNDDCETTANVKIISRSSNRSLSDPIFCQGEEAHVCLEFLYDPGETGVDWFHSIIPNFGEGWDMTAFDPANVTTTPDGARWFGPDNAECAPYLTENLPLICTYTDASGKLQICNMKCGPCPCTAPMDSLSPMPGGWYWVSNGGQGCENTCNPSTSYGYPGSNTGIQITLCMDLKTKSFEGNDCPQNNDLQITFTTTSDGMTGCWEDPVESCSFVLTRVGPAWELDCSELSDLNVSFEDAEISNGEKLNSLFTASDTNYSIKLIPVVNSLISGMNEHTFTNGTGTVSDQLFNLSDTVQTAQYLVYSLLGNNVCYSLPDTFYVVVRPPVCDNGLPFSQWESCKVASENTVICHLSLLDQMCGEMFSNTSSDPSPSPLCPDGGVSNNMTWIAFVAGEGSYNIVVSPSNCQPGTGGQLGAQIGVYADCSFTEAVFCNAPCDLAPVSIPDSLLTPGQTYYLFIDGCAGSICEYNIDVTGTYSSEPAHCDDGNPETINDVYDENCKCKGTDISCDPVRPYAQWESCKIASQNKVLCNLSILDRMCGEMFTTISTDPKPDPLCPLDGGAAHNMSWIAFVAEEGSYEIVVTPSDCVPGTGGQLGVQIGVYTDCSFTESVICNPACDINPVTIPDSLLTPGKTYYLFIDGCAQSVCNYTIDVNGTYSSKDVPCDDGNPLTINDMYDENCECKGELINATNQENPDKMQIFPNPANENVYVLHTGKYKDIDISILNAVGETIVIQKSKIENGYELHTSGLSPGVYLIKIRKDNVISSHKLVKY